MSCLKRLIHEIHRRSLWQVLLIYVGAAWACFELIDTVTGRLGLPVWLPGLAIVLFLLALPVVLATAFVREDGLARLPAEGAEAEAIRAHREARRKHRALTWRNAGLGFVVVLGVWGIVATGWLVLHEREATEEVDERPVIAVLPLENLSPDPDQAFFAAGVQEDLTSKLQRIPSLAVISRTSADRYRDPDNRPSLRDIASELGADFLVEGSVRVAGDSVRITVQLIEGSADVHLWAEAYDAPYSVEHYVRLQAQIVQRIASDLRVAVSPEDRAWLEVVPTGNLAAYEAYMRGNEAFLAERSRGTWVPRTASISWYEQAVALDPGFALAHAALALSLTHTVRRAGRYERGKQAAERALTLGGEILTARLALQRYYLSSGEEEEADRQFEMAAQLAPDHPLVIRSLAAQQGKEGDIEEAIQTLLRGEQLDPRNPLLLLSLGSFYTYLHRFGDALDAYGRAAAFSERPQQGVLKARARIHLMRGDHEQARAAISEMSKLQQEDFTYSAYSSIATTLNRVILRFMTAEQRGQAFAAFVDGWTRLGMSMSCERVMHGCVQRAVHEQEVGSREKARILWDSLRVAIENNPPPHEWFYHTGHALIYMQVGEEEAALAVAQATVNSVASDGCRGYEGPSPDRPKTCSCLMLARALAHFGKSDESIDILEEMLPAPSWLTVHLLEIDPIWDPLRDHPRFQALLEEYEQ